MSQSCLNILLFDYEKAVEGTHKVGQSQMSDDKYTVEVIDIFIEN